MAYAQASLGLLDRFREPDPQYYHIGCGVDLDLDVDLDLEWSVAAECWPADS